MSDVKTPVKKTTAKTNSSSATTLPKDVFNVEINNHELLQRAYQAYLANSRRNLAVTKTRGLVRGGGRKPWRQKGTGRARFGSSRNPIWRGGGIAFGPTGNENYTKTIPTAQKRKAIRQALTIANTDKKITVIPAFTSKEGKVKVTLDLIKKYKLVRNTLLVVDEKNEMIDRSTRNVNDIKVVQAMYLNVYDVINADNILITKKSVEIVHEWLSPSHKASENKGDKK
jgi:large subunit ribosomal protein L4